MLAGFRTARATAVGEYPTRHLVGCRLAFTLKPIEGTRDLASFQKTPKLTDQNNFRGEHDNIWWRTETGILALPEHLSPPADLVPVKGDEITVPVKLNARDGVAVAAHYAMDLY